MLKINVAIGYLPIQNIDHVFRNPFFSRLPYEGHFFFTMES